ncbi:DUF5710 domain-containing protein [Bartonella sp. DGB2]|uniref:DUF5710 domain-containing protein n=1 Tax=Bartonella sp. DGB2 TaxID=3388426 RepID=UPI00398F965E
MDRVEAEAIVKLFLEDYPGGYKLAYKIRKNTDELYGRMAKEVPLDIKGGYISKHVEGNNGKVYQGRVDIVLDNTDSPEDLLLTLRHEVIGHYGANTFDPKEKKALLDSLIHNREEDTLKPLWDTVSKNYPHFSLQYQAEEVIALFAENIEPRHHIGKSEIHSMGQMSLYETCIKKSRPMTVYDLKNITLMVADGLHKRTRSQQTFPNINELLRRGDTDMDTDFKIFPEKISEKIIEQLKEGVAPWQRPWVEVGALPRNFVSGRRYHGLNIVSLLSEGFENKYDQQYWMTSNQASFLGGQVREGEKGTLVSFWKLYEEKDAVDDQNRPIFDEDGERVKTRIPLEQPIVYNSVVFNVNQIDGLPPIQSHNIDKGDPLKRAEHILKASGANIINSNVNIPFYKADTDSIVLPPKEKFANLNEYYAAVLHELGHWTGHSSRLNRDVPNFFNSKDYAREELRAEIFSMLIADELGIAHNQSQHASYVNSWIEILEENPAEISRALHDAEKMFKHVMSYERKQVQEHEHTYIHVPYTEKDEAKKLGALWDKEAKSWYVEAGADLSAFQKWIKPASEAVLMNTDLKNEQSVENKRIYLTVPYAEKDEVKKLGALWDRQEKSWYISEDVNVTSFEKWLDPSMDTTAVIDTNEKSEHSVQNEQSVENKRIYLAVPYGDKEEAKKLGALWDKEAKSWYVEAGTDLSAFQKWDANNVVTAFVPSINPREEFAEAMRGAGLVVGSLRDGDHPIMDGKTHRVPVEGGKRGSLDGFYIAHLDDYPAGRIINYKTGVDIKWKGVGLVISPEEKAKLQADVAKKQQERAAMQEKLHMQVADHTRDKINTLIPIKGDENRTPYLQSKGIRAHRGAYTDMEKKVTYIPAFDANGKAWSMQYIKEDGTKRFAKDGKKQGLFHVVGGIDALDEAPLLVISEGYATAASIAEAVDHATVAAFDAGNLVHVARALHDKYPNKPILIAGDDDRAQEIKTGRNPGREKAEEAALAVGGISVLPIFAPNEQENNPKQFTDFNDLANNSELGQIGILRQLLASCTRATTNYNLRQETLKRNEILSQEMEQEHTKRVGRSR